ncbi:MAG: UDP-N-acetylmuramate dehydrogenase [Gammaproteobacteria bacterium]|nr:UDP-N-acetylmuramate dehydrogenase [Gammaproteobacteria bacterium]
MLTARRSSREAPAGTGVAGVRGELRCDEPMARHTSWRAGGRARRFFVPADAEDLVQFLRGTPSEEPLLWVGLGSNLLVRDGGLSGTVISTARLNACCVIDEGAIVAEAGATCARIARWAAQLGLTGAEFLAGIPGTLGGALCMNAGAFGGDTWGLIGSVETIDRRGERRHRARPDFEIGYREVRGPADEWYLSAELVLAPDPEGGGLDRIKALLGRRAGTQPMGQPSCGSVFQNPPGDHAARLIDASGLKGLSIGNAVVSEKHANFIVNRGGATATDIEALIEHVRGTVAERQGVWLKPEVRIVGEGPKA